MRPGKGKILLSYDLVLAIDFHILTLLYSIVDKKPRDWLT